MQKILFRRTLRQFRANSLRYIALFLLIVFAMGLAVAVVGGAGSVIETVNRKAEENRLEDGQFSVFVPLAESEAAEIETMGITLEECFSLDYSLGDGSTLRVMKNRQEINLIELADGRLTENEDEIVLERIYATAHELGVGDTLQIGGRSFVVCGVGTTPDYDACYKNMSDMSADGKVFGTAFVTGAAYDTLRTEGAFLSTESCCYSYRLSPGGSGQALKDYLLTLTANPDDVQDIFFQQLIQEETEDRDAFTDGVSELVEGSTAIDGALNDLRSGAGDLLAGIRTAYDGLNTLHSSSGTLNDGSAQVLQALEALEAGAGQLGFSLSDIQSQRAAAAALLEASKALEQGLDTLAGSASYEGVQAILPGVFAQAGMDGSALSPDGQIILGALQNYLNELSGGLAAATSGASGLREGLEAFDSAVSSLPDAMEALQEGIGQLSSSISLLRHNYGSLDGGLGEYTGGLDAICEGFSKIESGAASLSSGADALAESSNTFLEGMSALQTRTGDLLEAYFPLTIDNLTGFIAAEDNPRIKAANGDVEINVNVGRMAGLIVLVLIAYVISVFTVHSIDRESAMIGALYALGLKRRQLMFHYTMLPVALCLLGGACGTALGYSRPMFELMVSESLAYYSTPAIDVFVSPALLVYGILLPPLTAFSVNCLVIRKRLNRTALSLLRKEASRKKASGLPLGSLSFPHAFQLRQLLREKRSCFAVLAGIFISLLVLILAVNCYVLCRNIEVQNVADTKYEYMYQFKYPEDTVPQGGHEAYVVGLKKEVLGYSMELSIIGLTGDNPYFPPIVSERKNELSLSSSAASKFGLRAGDELILRDEVHETVYTFTVKEIVPYAPGLCAFMDIGSMRELFGQEDGCYNVVYSGQALDIDAGRLYATTTKADVEKSAAIFTELMMSMVVTLTAAALLIFFIVLYQMTGVMIDRSAVSISLMKVFGYRDREIRKLYLDGNLGIIALGMLILLPAAKFLMDAVYPSFVANVACGIDLSWPFALYAAIYLETLLGYLLIRTALMRRLKKLTPAEILKDRE